MLLALAGLGLAGVSWLGRMDPARLAMLDSLGSGDTGLGVC